MIHLDIPFYWRHGLTIREGEKKVVSRDRRVASPIAVHGQLIDTLRPTICQGKSFIALTARRANRG